MLTAPQLIYSSKFPLTNIKEGKCYVCGGALYNPVPLKSAIKSTFSDFANMHTEGNGVCEACQWFMISDRRTDLQEWLSKDKAQSTRTYSHILKNNQWHIYSKGQKSDILQLLAHGDMPEVCIIAVSGQKHLFYLARANPPNQSQGWVLYEHEHIWIDQYEFNDLVYHVSSLYLPDNGYNKQCILTGSYIFGKLNSRELYLKHEPYIKPYRGTTLLDLAVYLVTKPKESEE